VSQGPGTAIAVEGLGVEYDLRLSPHRTLRQTLGDLVRMSKTEAPRFWGLQDVSFNLRNGEVLGVVGSNGSGKSTLLLALSGILQPDRGTVVTYGKTSALLTLGAGFEPTLTGRENIYLNAAFLGVSRKFIRERAEAIIEFADVGDFIDVPVGKYSAGMRARLGFAIASHIEPDILLLDEVLSVGDVAFKTRSEQRLREFVEQAKAIVVVSHSLEFIAQMCTTALWLESGKVRGYGPTEEILPAYAAAPAPPRPPLGLRR
jgi:ABC-type polysaccharide/polyol phosphate transport system ATPase subunit